MQTLAVSDPHAHAHTHSITQNNPHALTCMAPGCVCGSCPVSLLFHSVKTLRLLLSAEPWVMLAGPTTAATPAAAVSTTELLALLASLLAAEGAANQEAGTSPSSLFWSSRIASRVSIAQSSGRGPVGWVERVREKKSGKTRRDTGFASATKRLVGGCG